MLAVCLQACVCVFVRMHACVHVYEYSKYGKVKLVKKWVNAIAANTLVVRLPVGIIFLLAKPRWEKQFHRQNEVSILDLRIFGS